MTKFTSLPALYPRHITACVKAGVILLASVFIRLSQRWAHKLGPSVWVHYEPLRRRFCKGRTRPGLSARCPRVGDGKALG